MRRGNYDRRITIEAPTTIESEYGPVPGPWEAIPGGLRIPAQVEDTLPSKSEAVKQGIRVASQPARIRMPYLRGITSDMRVVVHGEDSDRTLQIIAGPAEMGRREGIEMVGAEYSS